MKFHDLEQGSPEWLEFRRTHVGASDAPRILLKNKDTLLKEKIHGKSSFKTAAMQRGHDLEPIARMLFEEGVGAKFPSAVVTHDTLTWMSASLDGICPELGAILEIKCCSKEIHEAAKQGEIPRDHMIQMQHALYVTDYKSAYYCHYDGGSDLAVIRVERDDALINSIVKSCESFYQELSGSIKPEEEGPRDDLTPVFHHERGAALMRELTEIRSRKAPLCEREKQLREEILEIAPDHNFVLEGVLVHRSQGRVTYDIERMKMDGIDVAKYEKSGKPVWTISGKT